MVERPDVIVERGATGMRWERWTDWQRGDARWRVHVVDTTALSLADVADAIMKWAESEHLASNRRGS